jgi:endonuclease-3 related protein
MFLQIYKKLHSHFGPQNWWPAETPFEVIIGAMLTQNTSWSNVEKAIENLKKQDLIDPEKLHNIENKKLEKLIISSGYYRQKTKKLKNFTTFLWKKYNGELKKLFDLPYSRLREELLSVKGIGKETADSIILYAAGKPVFVIDAYTKRVLSRVGITKEKDYDKLQKLFHKKLPQDTQLFNEFHALLVILGKNYCKRNPKCNDCPLNQVCEYTKSYNQ